MSKVDYSRVTVRLGEAEAKKLAELARETDRPVSNLVRV
jgi:predicted transcriptional regulator